MTDLVFLDIETTGLDQDKHEVWEIAWAVNDDMIRSRVVVHSLKTADPVALDINGYFRRNAETIPRSDGPWVDLDIRKAIEGNTLVCANPPFDRGFLRKRWGIEPWHYRSIDVESMALIVFGWLRPRGLKDVAAELRTRGHEVPEPDHTAAKDVEVLRTCFNLLHTEMDWYRIRR